MRALFRECNVVCLFVEHTLSLRTYRDFDAKCIVFSGRSLLRGLKFHWFLLPVYIQTPTLTSTAAGTMSSVWGGVESLCGAVFVLVESLCRLYCTQYDAGRVFAAGLRRGSLLCA